MTAIERIDIRQRLAAMVADLRRTAAIRSVDWAQAFSSIPRHIFVPEFFRQETDPRGIATWRPLRIDSGHRRWLDAVYSDQTLVTALDPGTAEPTGDGAFTGVATSSSTLPSLMARMLEDLDVSAGMRVLEVGTGTGYNAALLCRRLGDQHVYSVDVDPALVETARVRLASLGHRPHIAAADGRTGYPPGAPYDRIISTCSVTRIPAEWLQQTRPGGIILTDITTGIDGGLVRLTVTDSHRGEGAFTTTTGRFMPARGDKLTYPRSPRPPYATISGTRESTVTAGDIRSHYPFRLIVGLGEPDIELVYHHDDETSVMALQLQRPCGCWARAPLPGQSGEGTVTWGGQDHVWPQVEEMWRWWHAHNRPDHTNFGVTTNAQGLTAWWQDPNGERRTLKPSTSNH